MSERPDPTDLLGFDRLAARAHERVARFREMCASPSEWKAARAFDPFAGVRDVSTQTTFRSLRSLDPSLVDRPLRDGLVRWTHAFLQERVGLDLAIDEAEARFAIDERVSPAQAMQRDQHAARTSDVDVVAKTYAEARRALVDAPDAGRAAIALTRLAELSPKVAAVRKERRERRFEASRRLGLSHPSALVTERKASDIMGFARDLLDRTEPLSEELFRVARKQEEAAWTAASAMQLGMARAASHGWPATLSTRWLSDVFSALTSQGRGLTKASGALRLPHVLGGATFLRAAYAWGFSFRREGVARSLLFALARDPYPTSAHRFGFAFAAAVADPTFQRRSLDVSPRFGGAQTRALRTTLFLETRLVAVRFLLNSEEQTSPSTFEELTARVFGRPLPPAMRDAWPTPRADDASRFLALLSVHSFVRGLVERFDDDWFRNPAAGAFLSSLACGPEFDDEPVSEHATADLARAFEEALG